MRLLICSWRSFSLLFTMWTGFQDSNFGILGHLLLISIVIGRGLILFSMYMYSFEIPLQCKNRWYQIHAPVHYFTSEVKRHPKNKFSHLSFQVPWRYYCILSFNRKRKRFFLILNSAFNNKFQNFRWKKIGLECVSLLNSFFFRFFSFCII